MASQVVFNAYSPGLFTATFLYIPVFLYLTYLALRERLLPLWFLPLALLLGPSSMAFSIWATVYHFGTVPCCQWTPFGCMRLRTARLKRSPFREAKGAVYSHYLILKSGSCSSSGYSKARPYTKVRNSANSVSMNV